MDQNTNWLLMQMLNESQQQTRLMRDILKECGNQKPVNTLDMVKVLTAGLFIWAAVTGQMTAADLIGALNK